MEELNFNSLDLVPIGKLLRNNQENWLRFYVPAYQRGYRWSGEQAEQLIDDLEEFKTRMETNKEAFYCIQPLVVKPISLNGLRYYEVIDGQQRLTTILLILQVLRQLQYEEERDEDALPYVKRLPREAYEIQYETRKNSSVWLNELSETLFSEKAFNDFDNANCDYSHFAEVFKSAYNKLQTIDRLDFKNILKDHTYFIWYRPSEEDNNNVEIFDRLNAGKIGLNNAELVKALLLQSSNIPTVGNCSMSDRDVIQKIAIEWDIVERTLRDESLWGFVYSKNTHGLTYESHIEYLLDLLKGKTKEDQEKRFLIFNSYLTSYRQMLKAGGFTDASQRLKWAKQQWDEVKSLFDLVLEWYEDRHLYHRIGFVLEYNSKYTLKKFQDILPSLSQSGRVAKLDEIIRDTVGKIKSTQLFHKNPCLSEILFLYNILLEDRRHSDTARFSFADYKQVRKNTGWDQEHVASSQDFNPDEKEQRELANDLIELITGNRPILVKGDEITPDRYELACEQTSLDEEEQSLCKQLLSILNQKDNNKLDSEKLSGIYDAITKHFNSDKDPLNGNFSNPKKREKDFIWNFVLLNAKTNRSYGNHIFPVKRRRILADEFQVYTPVGTRNVFEKAYSRKIDHFFAWTRTDAKAYWADIKRVVYPYVQLTDLQ